MPAHKVFRSAPRPKDPPIEFELEAETVDGDVRHLPLHAIAARDARLDEIMASIVRFVGDDMVADVAGVRRYLKACLVSDTERVDFDKFLDDPALFVTTDTLVEVYQWLMETQTGRPTPGS